MLESLRRRCPARDDPASIKDQIEVPPFILAEATDLAALIVPEFDAEIDLPVQNLDFLTLLTGDMEGLDLKGQGRLRGRLVFAHGELLPGTDLIVEAHELAMILARHTFNGGGTIELKVDPDDADQADLMVRFDEVSASLLAEHPDAATEAGDVPAMTLFSGRRLEALLHTEMRGGKPDIKLTLTVPAMEVPDLRGRIGWPQTGEPPQRRQGPLPDRHRARHVADRLRRALPAHPLCRQAHAGPRPHAGYRA
ncbi:MAG: hypothetical protein WAT36_11735 [Chromatiaceae bacterium]